MDRTGLAGVVDGVGDEGEKAGALDRANYARLLLAGRAGAPGGFDFAGWRDKLDQDVEPLIIDLFGLELGYGFSAGAAKLSDGDNSFLTHAARKKERHEMLYSFIVHVPGKCAKHGDAAIREGKKYG